MITPVLVKQIWILSYTNLLWTIKFPSLSNAEPNHVHIPCDILYCIYDSGRKFLLFNCANLWLRPVFSVLLSSLIIHPRITMWDMTGILLWAGNPLIPVRGGFASYVMNCNCVHGLAQDCSNSIPAGVTAPDYCSLALSHCQLNHNKWIWVEFFTWN